MSEIIWTPSLRHECDLPSVCDHDLGTIARCGECKRYSRVVFGIRPEPTWKTWKRMDAFDVFFAALAGRIRTDAAAR